MSPSPAVLTIDLLRHGETEAQGGRLYGATDIPLSAKGKQQLRAAAGIIARQPLTGIASSPRQRCSWLAEQLQGDIAPTIETGFSEMDFGDWEGESVSQLLEHDKNFRLNLSLLAAPNGENFKTFALRVRQTWESYIRQHLGTGGHHLIITHGGVIRVLLGSILEIPDSRLHSLFIPHAAWSRITLVQGEPPVLWFVNHAAE